MKNAERPVPAINSRIGQHQQARAGDLNTMAFPRSPTITAMSAWTLQKVSSGDLFWDSARKCGHMGVVRNGNGYACPGADILAMKAVWRCWQDREPLNHDGDHYKLV